MAKKKENHTKPLRLFKVEQAIQNMSYPNVEKLMDKLEVSRRTVLRDIEELKLYYAAPIEYDKVRKGYYYTDNTYFVKNMMLTESEVFAVTGILPLMEQSVSKSFIRLRVLSSVDLPQPDGPMYAVISFFGISIFTFFKA